MSSAEPLVVCGTCRKQYDPRDPEAVDLHTAPINGCGCARCDGKPLCYNCGAGFCMGCPH
jgi:hypothetical protein